MTFLVILQLMYILVYFFLTFSKIVSVQTHTQITKLPDCLLHLFRNMLVYLCSRELFTVQ